MSLETTTHENKIGQLQKILIGPIPIPEKGGRNRLVAKVREIDSLGEFEVMRMHKLFREYYEDHPYEQFRKDLFAKDDVILLIDAKSKNVEGFSTLLKVEFQKAGRKVNGIYSGDTVLSKAYWGSPALGVAFLKYLWMQKIKSPLTPLYWFLISKGYKTYLLMANNFLTHYPRLETATPPEMQEIMDKFYSERFSELYDPSTGLLRPKGPSCHLKDNVADISLKDLENSRIAFFAEKNPNWKKGSELCCVAAMTLEMPARYVVKKFWKGLFR